MKTIKPTLSRGPEVDVEACIKEVGGNKFDLVLIATARSRELTRQHRDAGHTTQLNSPVLALLDIQAGLIDPKVYLEKSGKKPTYD